MKNSSVWSRSHLEPPFFAWSQSRPNLVGDGVDSVTSTFGAGAALKSSSSGSATLLTSNNGIDYHFSFRVHLDIQVGEHAIDYANVAQKEKLSELQLRVRQLLDQVKQVNPI